MAIMISQIRTGVSGILGLSDVRWLAQVPQAALFTVLVLARAAVCFSR